MDTDDRDYFDKHFTSLREQTQAVKDEVAELKLENVEIHTKLDGRVTVLEKDVERVRGGAWKVILAAGTGVISLLLHGKAHFGGH